MEVWRCLRDLKVFEYGPKLIRRKPEVEEEVEEVGLGEKLFVDLPVAIVQVMELMKMMNWSWFEDVVRLSEFVVLGQGYQYLPMKEILGTVGQ
jgi:hypothetical protein